MEKFSHATFNKAQMRKMNSLSLSLFFGYHDSSISISDGHSILLHLEAERYFREKHCRIETLEKMELLVLGGLSYLNKEIDEIERLYISTLGNPLDTDKVKLLGKVFSPIITTHHNSHIGTTNHHGFDDAIIVVADGGSEDGSTKIYFQNIDNEIELVADLGETCANGKFYGSLTMLVIEPDFFKAHGWDSGKTMGLSAYGNFDINFANKLELHTPKLLWGNVLDVKKMRQDFDLSDDYSRPWLDQRRMDLAHTGQKYWVNGFVEHLKTLRFKSENIVIVGGCALNVLLNSEIIDSGLFKRIYIGIASGDCGQSLGNIMFHEPNTKCPGPYLGRGFGDLNELPKNLVEDLLSGKLVAWYQGRSEIGPRALGHRSILGLPDHINKRDRLNQLKGREPYRPIAPMVLLEKFKDYFNTNTPSPYMSFAPKVKPITKELAPAIVHADDTSRMQTLSRSDNSILHEVLNLIGEETGAPILMNTSFNIAGEAIVDTPEDAYQSFKKSGLDVLYVNGERTLKEQITQ